jgi:hypothetical protein
MHGLHSIGICRIMFMAAKMKRYPTISAETIVGSWRITCQNIEILNPIRQFYACNMTTSKVTCAFSRVGSLPTNSCSGLGKSTAENFPFSAPRLIPTTNKNHNTYASLHFNQVNSIKACCRRFQKQEVEWAGRILPRRKNLQPAR